LEAEAAAALLAMFKAAVRRAMFVIGGVCERGERWSIIINATEAEILGTRMFDFVEAVAW
jgi:hypothetical protein